MDSNDRAFSLSTSFICTNIIYPYLDIADISRDGDTLLSLLYILKMIKVLKEDEFNVKSRAGGKF